MGARGLPPSAPIDLQVFLQLLTADTTTSIKERK